MYTWSIYIQYTGSIHTYIHIYIYVCAIRNNMPHNWCIYLMIYIYIIHHNFIYNYIYTCNLQDLHNFLPYWQNQPFKSQPEFWGMSWFCIFKVCTPLEILNKRYQEIYHHNHPHFQAPMNQQGEAAPIIQWLKSGYLRSVQGLVVRKENQSLWITQTIEALIINHSTCPADAMQ